MESLDVRIKKQLGTGGSGNTVFSVRIKGLSGDRATKKLSIIGNRKLAE